MCHVAAEMEREGFNMPLLIGGATTSRVHTAVKINPNYARGQTIYVTDASRAVGVVSSLIRTERAPAMSTRSAPNTARSRESHAKGEGQEARLPLAGARDNAFTIDWSGLRAGRGRASSAPAQFRPTTLAELVPYIDWTPFFQTWELAGTYPRILDDNVVGLEARAAVRRRAGHAQAAWSRSKWLTANAVIGFWPANAVGDDIELYADEARKARSRRCTRCASRWRARASATRQHGARRFRRAAAGIADYVGGFAVTAGHRRGGAHRRSFERERRLFRDPAAGARRPAGGGLRRAHA